jgi:hypothetical protein
MLESLLPTLESLVPMLVMLGLGYLAVPLVLGVPMVKKMHWISKAPQIQPAEDIPQRAQTWIAGQRPQYDALGFTYVGVYQLTGFTPGVTTYFGLYRHSEDGLAATSVWIDAGLQSTHYDEISQLFQGGDRGLTVNNSAHASSWQRDNFYVGRFPWLREIADLWRIHRGLAQRQPQRGMPVALGQEIDVLRRHIQQEVAEQVKAGIYRAGPEPQRYVLTWPGAVHMVWRNAFPGKQLHNAQELRAHRRAAEPYLRF